MAAGHLGRLDKQQPGHHALHILQLDLERRIHPHRPLHPFGAQMQVADVAVVGEIDFGQGACACFQGGLIIATSSAAGGLQAAQWPWRQASPCACSTSSQAARLRSNDQLALAGLVEGSL